MVPLLIDMYGTGCLRNISSLAAQSDEAMGLVAQNIYDPFMKYVVSLLYIIFHKLTFYRL